jgi:aminoglycoside phosphotransferase (APT) family kinase protein
MSQADSARFAEVEPEWRRAFEWVERELGGRVVRYERQPRWRPSWFLDVERGSETLPLYFRGDRGALDHGVYPLEHELKILQLLERHEIPVPHVYGFCPDPRGIVMARVPGLGTAAVRELPTEAERNAVVDHYVELAARMHAIDLKECEAIGLTPPKSAEAIGLGDLPHYEKAYRREKRRPDPMIEFTLQWLKRNVPRHRTRAALLQGDSGQFLFEKGRITALHDLELATLGDPMAEFAGMRNRTLSEPLGDLSRALRHYEKVTGEPADRRAVDYHTARFGIVTPLTTAHLVADPPPGVEFVQYLAWYRIYGRLCLEVIANLLGVALEPISEPASETTRHASAHTALRAMLAPRESDDPVQAYERRTPERVARYLERAERFGPELEREDLDEAAVLLGKKLMSWRDADAQLEAFVLKAGPGDDARIVRFLHRHFQRQEFLLKGALFELENTVIEPIS